MFQVFISLTTICIRLVLCDIIKIQIAKMNDQVLREDLALVVLIINLYVPSSKFKEIETWSLFFKRGTSIFFETLLHIFVPGMLN